MTPAFLVLRNLALTVLIEGALVLIFARRGKTLYHSVLVNMLTNPALNLCLIFWSTFVLLPADPYYYIITTVLEIAAVVTEWILYYKMGDFGIKKALFASLGLNAASFSFGFLIQ